MVRKIFIGGMMGLFSLLQFSQHCCGQADQPAPSAPLEYRLDMVFNNPGGKPFKTKYNNPFYVKSQGFTGMVTDWFVNCAITYDNYKKNVIPPGSPERAWIENQAHHIDSGLAVCKKAGIKVYAFTDFLVFPKSIWKKYGNLIRRPGTGHEDGSIMGSQGKSMIPDIRRKTTQDLLRAQIDGIFDRFPQLAGLVVRFGETYLYDTPFDLGGSPIRGGMAGVEDQIIFINILRQEVCVKRNKKIFYRTWDFGNNFHNNPAYYLAVTDAVQPDSNLIFSIKYQQGDFLRMTPFNPTLGIGKHRQIVEFEACPEVYGKEAHPFYAAKGMIDGWPETKYQIKGGRFTGKRNNPACPRGVKDILHKGLLAGVFVWSRGGGWDGPYIKNEFWVDLNTYVASQWAQKPWRSEKDIFYDFAALHSLTGRQADLFRKIALLSVEGVLKGQCNSYTVNNLWWSRDQYFSAAGNRGVIARIIKDSLEEKVLAEKAEAADIWKQIEDISKQITLPDTVTQDVIRVSCTYGRIEYALIQQMWILMIQQGLIDKGVPANKDLIRKAIAKYDSLWAEWRALKKSSKYCATLYTDLAFRGKRAGSIGELVDKMRTEIK